MNRGKGPLDEKDLWGEEPQNEQDLGWEGPLNELGGRNPRMNWGEGPLYV